MLMNIGNYVYTRQGHKGVREQRTAMRSYLVVGLVGWKSRTLGSTLFLKEPQT